jgi:hypothetical protein
MHNQECLYPLCGVERTRFDHKLVAYFLSPILFLASLSLSLSLIHLGS